MTDPAAEAILGHKSAASLATGPVIYDPFMSPLGNIITPALSSHLYRKTILSVQTNVGQFMFYIHNGITL